ncbi:MAG: hypothetical protein JWP44_4485 [Mucilaginibacter sp.]|nr:hypothetical protein [Mucilaginibacter sp.]
MTEVQTIAAEKNSKRARKTSNKGTAPKKGKAADLIPIADAMKTAPKKGNGSKSSKATGTIDKTTSKTKGKATAAQPTAAVPAKDRAKSFWLSDEKIAILKTEYKDTKSIPIPYSTGAYRYFLLALVQLGADKPHTFQAVKGEMRSLMSAPDTKDDDKQTAWQRFINKDGRAENADDNKNADERIAQNAEVLQRLGGNTPYGQKLWEVSKVIKSKGVVVDILKSKDGKERLYRLNLNASIPTNEFRRTRIAK